MIGRLSVPIAIEVWKPTLLAPSIAVIVSFEPAQAVSLQYATRRSPAVRSK
jgi:hypothetical protein